MESGLLVRTDEGTPQGGNLSPMPANIFLHYVLDLWFVKRVQRCVDGQCYLVRYADDFVCMVQNRQIAGEIESMLRERFAKFGLTLHPEKTRTISFGRYERQNARRDGRRANTFDFLGFTHYCGLNRKGFFLLGRKTSGKRFRKACTAIYNWLRRIRNVMDIKDWWPSLAAKLRGHYNYYGVSGNSQMVANFGYVTIRAVNKWLNRRSQRKSFTWKQLNAYLAHYPLARPRIVHNFYKPSPSREID